MKSRAASLAFRGLACGAFAGSVFVILLDPPNLDLGIACLAIGLLIRSAVEDFKEMLR